MTTIVCSDCNQTFGKKGFSKSQLKKKATETRRCLSCAIIVNSNSNCNSNSNNNSDKNPCYHGCTKEEFNSGEHQKILDSYSKENNTEKRMEIVKTVIHLMINPIFGRFVIAHVADDYLTGKDDDILFHRLFLLKQIRYLCIPSNEGKDVGPESKYNIDNRKYSRDIRTKRGRIKFIAREIPCDCMTEKRIEAKSMEKVAMCFKCGNEFLKEKMFRGCDGVQYCTKECSKKDWHKHKELCKRNSVSSTPGSGSLPSFGETINADIDVDVDVDAEEEREKV